MSAGITILESQARFALYIANHFSLSVSSFASGPIQSRPIQSRPVQSSASSAELQLVDAELKVKYILVYQELELSTDILMELYNDQIHLINLDILGIKQALEFNRTTTTQAVTHASPY